MPDVDSTLRKIGHWKYLIKTDLTSAFFQIPLDKSSLKYCGVATPFRGIRVYTRSAMGMPGSETALEELMCAVLGDLIVQGYVVKIADDLYCGGETPNELLIHWKKVLLALANSSLRLSASKTVIAPKSTSVLGWKWQQGTLTATTHRLTALSTCEPPKTVKGLRSFIGAFKVLSRAIPKCSSLLSSLEEFVAGRSSGDTITWDDTLLSNFDKAKQALTDPKTIHLPRPDDQLWIVTDGAVKAHGLGATLYITRDNNKPLLSGFFSAKLKKRQIDWFPCELEALCIAASIKHFSPYIVQSSHKPCVLTDSKPCVQAHQKLLRGSFSTSSKLTTFMSTASRYQTSIRHLSGTANTPSDFTCRNAEECLDESCQVCRYVSEIEQSPIRAVSVKDIISGTIKLPFTTRSTWRSVQSEDPDLRRTHAHLTQGTRPSKKATNIRDVKRYLQFATIARDGLLIVRQVEPFAPTIERIIIPRSSFPGLLASLHIRLDHPSPHQMRQVLRRHFFALDMDQLVEEMSSSCHLCAALKTIKHAAEPQSVSSSPTTVASQFASDVLRRNRQFILILREYVTSFTASIIIDREDKLSLRNALVTLLSQVRSPDGPQATVRVDPAPGFQALKSDEILAKYGIVIDIGSPKNKNKTPLLRKPYKNLN